MVDTQAVLLNAVQLELLEAIEYVTDKFKAKLHDAAIKDIAGVAELWHSMTIQERTNWMSGFMTGIRLQVLSTSKVLNAIDDKLKQLSGKSPQIQLDDCFSLEEDSDMDELEMDTTTD